MTARPPFLVALTTHAVGVSVDARERFRAALAERALPGAVTVATCHRVEVYLEPGEGDDDVERVLPEGGRRLEDGAAARHAMRLALGLDSAILGEDQVLHQVREAVQDARGRGRLGGSVERLFRIALREGRRTRAWRRQPAGSLADVAVERVEDTLGGLRGRRVLVVGTGRMGALLA